MERHRLRFNALHDGDDELLFAQDKIPRITSLEVHKPELFLVHAICMLVLLKPKGPVDVDSLTLCAARASDQEPQGIYNGASMRFMEPC